MPSSRLRVDAHPLFWIVLPWESNWLRLVSSDWSRSPPRSLSRYLYLSHTCRYTCIHMTYTQTHIVKIRYCIVYPSVQDPFTIVSFIYSSLIYSLCLESSPTGQIQPIVLEFWSSNNSFDILCSTIIVSSSRALRVSEILNTYFQDERTGPGLCMPYVVKCKGCLVH